MSITIGATSPITLPEGLVWIDEFDWSPVQRTAHRHPGGWYVERATACPLRPITLEGGQSWCWISRANLLTLQTLLETAGPHLLTLHDGRQFDVEAVGQAGVVEARPVPVVADSGPTDPTAATNYYIIRIPLVGVAHV